MEWLSAENVIAVGTALLGVLASGGLVWYERRVPSRKRVGYRVQTDNPIGNEVSSGRPNVRTGFFHHSLNMDDATLVLLRIENDGSQSITRDDYTVADRHGLTAVFTDRVIEGVSVTEPTGDGDLTSYFTEERGFGYEGNRLRIPRVPLNRGDYFKLLVLLTGGDVGCEVRLVGGIRDGKVHRNRGGTPDDKPPVFSFPARILTALLTVSVLVLAGIILLRDGNPIGCERGTLTLTGSTAFAPVIEDIADTYEDKCQGAEITVDAGGSEAGVADLGSLVKDSADDAGTVIAFSDGPLGEGRGLKGDPVALSVFTVVVHDGVGAEIDRAGGLSVPELQEIYGGDATRWGDILPDAPPDIAALPVVMVSRGDDSGTRQVFQDRVLDGWEAVPSTSRDCDPTNTPVTRCELGSTEAVLDKVASRPGAIGYSELRFAQDHDDITLVALDGREADIDLIAQGTADYPYRDVEYAYTSPSPTPLTTSFLDYLKEATSQETIHDSGHLPCPRHRDLCPP
ncbi:PstS family phosphate ABC transporter substrate-binding protein [Streptomyces sp. B93]|uniref:PstS family phosphate ABC transporter substrate-binding protein n=1 Tax=Streptomyces sp. B93 TaxID=2824875 RepID=UPI001B38515F|nr:substrate-binding domain-containing protein [Streptomyces sp. B93]MBQ1092143.1 substrate-binding domain-containing protein [Streptomyces sp. B93]